MSTTYKSTLTIRCWKEHVCVACECVYAYRFSRTVTGQSSNENEVIENARRSALHAIEHDLDAHPCPTCGRYQPDMIAKRRRGIHVALLIGMFVILGIVATAYLTLHGPDILIGWLGTLAALVTIAITLLSSLEYFNGDLEANQKRALRSLRTGELAVSADGHAPFDYEEPIAFHKVKSFWLAIGMMIVGALGISTPEWVRILRGWKLEEGRPAVMGPGDETKFYLDQSISSIQGMWNGSATVHATPENGPVENWAATTSKASWGRSIAVKSRDKSSNASLWVKVIVPDRPELAGKRYRLRLDLAVNYPVADGFNSFDIQTGTFGRTVDVQLNSPRAGASYARMRWFGLLIGGGVFFVGLWIIFRMGQAYKHLALPTAAYADNR